MTKTKVTRESLPIDLKSVLKRLDEDEAFLKELLELYELNFLEFQKNLKEALSRKNYGLIQELGHSLKGSSANLSLIPLKETAFIIEEAGRKKDLEKAKKAFSALKKEFHRLKDFLAQR